MQDKVFLCENENGEYYFLGFDVSSGEKATVMLVRPDLKESIYRLTIRKSERGFYVVSYGKRISINNGLKNLLERYTVVKTCKTQKNVVKCNCGGNIKATQKDIMLMESQYVNVRGEALGEIIYKQVGQPIDPRYSCADCGTTYHKRDLKHLKRERVSIDRSTGRS